MTDKSLPPSEQKRREAREKGQFARSRTFSSAASTVGGVLGTALFFDDTRSTVHDFTVQMLELRVAPPTAMVEAVWRCARAVAPTFGGAWLGAFVASLLMAGVHMNAGALAPDLARLDFVAGFKRLFSLRTFVDTLKTLVMLGLLILVFLKLVQGASALVFLSSRVSALAAASALNAALGSLVVKLSLVLLLLSVADVAHAKFRHTKDLMMSHDDVKREHKSAEGDPHAKHERKALAKKLAQSGPARGVHRATAVVVNPTHIAIAIRYDELENDVPYVVAKGRGADAFAIRAQANSLKIPIVKDVPLARSLIHFDVGEDVPEELFAAAAAVLKVALAAANADACPLATPGEES